MPARALVTGASGFIGSALVRRLKHEGSFVRAIVRAPRESTSSGADALLVANLTAPLDAGALDGIDVVYHLAAKTHDTAEAAGAEADYHRINVEGTRALVDAAVSRRVPRFVFVSSVKAMDEGGEEMRDELRPPSPETAYGRTKLAAERLVFGAAARGGIAPVCVRFPIVYGPGQRGNLARMIRAIDRGRFPPPPETHNRRSMLHVENAVESLVLAGRHEMARGQTYIVADALPYSTRQIYDWIRAALGRPPIRWSVPVWSVQVLALVGDAMRIVARRSPGFDSKAAQRLLGSAWYSPAKITRELAYRPAHDLRSAMGEIVASYRSRPPGDETTRVSV